jgi:hypothetical protein
MLKDKESPIRKIITTELDFFRKQEIATAVTMATMTPQHGRYHIQASLLP